MEQLKASPKFYRGIAIVFFLLGAVFLWAAFKQHSWFYGAFAGITIMNGLMSSLKALAAAETNK